MTFFGPDSIFNRPIIKDPVLDKNSADICEYIRNDVMSKPVGLGRGPSSGVPIYFVPDSYPMVPVATKYGTQGWKRLLAERFAQGVPMPPNAQPQNANHDQDVVVVQAGLKRMWEMWQVTGPPWSFNWGGYMEHLDRCQARYLHIDDVDGNPIQLPNWGVSASGISVAGGVVLADELAAGEIPHALQLLVPLARQGCHAYPAQRQDGRDPHLISCPEGAHLQVDPSYDGSKLPWPLPLFVRAAQIYGIVILDQTGGIGTTFRCQTAASATWMRDMPAMAESEFLMFEDHPLHAQSLYDEIDLARLFPWDHIRLMPMSLRYVVGGQVSDPTRHVWSDATQSYIAVA